jgi:hypothetical protein
LEKAVLSKEGKLKCIERESVISLLDNLLWVFSFLWLGEVEPLLEKLLVHAKNMAPLLFKLGDLFIYSTLSVLEGSSWCLHA